MKRCIRQGRIRWATPEVKKKTDAYNTSAWVHLSAVILYIGAVAALHIDMVRLVVEQIQCVRPTFGVIAHHGVITPFARKDTLKVVYVVTALRITAS